MSDLTGKCKKEISLTMPVFTDRDDFTKEYKIEIGNYESINCNYKLDGQKPYYIMLHHKRIYMDRDEVEEHFEIVWENKCYNTCIREGVPCKKIGHYIPEGTTSRDRYDSNCCSIGWEIGRGACREFE